MGAFALLPPLPWAIHISPGLLRPGWCAAGYAVAGLLALWGAWGIRDEEIPRVALLAAVFFVASLIPVPVPTGHVHLLLNGLLGVILGRRALLAIFVGLFLQATLFMHGGLDALGVNTCVMGVPALLGGVLFAGLRRLPALRTPPVRSALVALSSAVFSLSVVYVVGLLFGNAPGSGDLPDRTWADHLTFHPATLLITGGLALLVAWGERYLENAPEFPVGLVLGEVCVLATVALYSVAMLAGGVADWSTQVLLTTLGHLPLAVLEGVILGFTIGFLARVKPEMLGGFTAEAEPAPAAETSPRTLPLPPPTLLLAVFFLLLTARPAHAHRLEAEHRVLPDGRVQIESWFDTTGDSPKWGTVQVFGPDGGLVTEGKLNEKGTFAFRVERPQTLRVVVSAGDGHLKELTIPRADLEHPGSAAPSPEEDSPADPGPFADRSSRVTVKDVLVGVGFLLALAAFVLSLRQARELRELRRMLNDR
jgi:cobalt/nickel transport system permease protein